MWGRGVAAQDYKIIIYNFPCCPSHLLSHLWELCFCLFFISSLMSSTDRGRIECNHLCVLVFLCFVVFPLQVSLETVIPWSTLQCWCLSFVSPPNRLKPWRQTSTAGGWISGEEQPVGNEAVQSTVTSRANRTFPKIKQICQTQYLCCFILPGSFPGHSAVSCQCQHFRWWGCLNFTVPRLAFTGLCEGLRD